MWGTGNGPCRGSNKAFKTDGRHLGWAVQRGPELMLRQAFRFVDSVVFYVAPENIRSQRALEKIGAVHQVECDAQGRVVYRIAASAFNGNQRSPNKALEPTPSSRPD